MLDSIHIDLTAEARETMASVKQLPSTTLAAIARVVRRENQFTVAHIVRDYLSFPKNEPAVAIGLRVQTGQLRSSLHASDPVISGQSVTSTIGSPVKYAAAHEFGATIPAHKITAKNGKALRFKIGDRVIFAKSVNIPEVHLPARGFVRRGITDRLSDYSAGISSEIAKAWNDK